MDERSYKNILIYGILCKNLIGAKPLHIMFNKVDEFIRVYDGTRYLVLFGPEKSDAIYNRIKYVISQKNGITFVFSQNYAKIKIDSQRFFTSRILIKLVLSKNRNYYYHNIF